MINPEGTALVAEIRAAASLIRDRAHGATPGPWTASPVWSPRAQKTSAVYSAALPPGSEVIGSTRSNVVVGPTQKFGGCWRPQDAEYIAVMHPVVAAAVAQMLDTVAVAMSMDDPVEQISGVVDEGGSDRDDWTVALSLARAVSGTTPRVSAAAPLAEQGCSYRDDPGHDHEQCLDQYAAYVAASLTVNAKDCMRRTAGDFIPKRGPAPAFATVETIRSLRDQGLTVYTGDDYHLTDLGRLVVDALRRAEAVTSR